MIIDIFENTRKTESNVKKSKPENRDYRIKKDENGNDEFTGTKKGDMRKRKDRDER